MHPSAEQLRLAKRMLALEGGSGSAEGCAMAAERTYMKLKAHLGPLIGTAGLESLLARSAKLSQHRFACLAEISIVQGSTNLHACLQSQEATVAADAGAALFGALLALLAAFIGERLTTQALGRAWPSIIGMANPETE